MFYIYGVFVYILISVYMYIYILQYEGCLVIYTYTLLKRF